MAQKSFIPTHPGEVIKDELEARGIPQKALADWIDVPYTMLNDILNERRPLPASIALALECALGISADILMGLQADYNMQKARNDVKIKQKLRSIGPYPMLPVNQTA